ncbi:SMP-30/gluconolactonase/LRE family protein [Sulfitobacter geojensis]|uniref:SMP-30/gluconolactonase/LRE family protein n=1 Tax=Sulfitobacter geojensis TaxID=1342299 RepID=UPI0004695E70|nr:SMP-30/gluconolactonase/LRE family protein [Sulfitobacter geojensis]KHA54083.1 Gluconolactonase [Sulfitobacter geojensis]NYI29901.1 gluconolactonase [Sulfitobacter geojensis]
MTDQPAKFTVRNDAFFDCMEPGATLEVVANGFGFTEGPIWHPREKWLLFSDIMESRQYKWSKADGLTPFRMPSNQANGNFFDAEGQIVSCEHASSSLVLHDHDGKRVKPIATHFEGKELNSPNDVVRDNAGRIWFTDPTFGRIREPLGILREPMLDFQGLFRLDPDGSLHAVIRDFQQPNGLCFSADGRRLFVNDSWGEHIRVFDLKDDGSVTGGEVWADITGDGEGVPDGMKCTQDDKILCNGPGGVHILSQTGETLGVILMPEKSTNFCFGDDGLSTLYVTASTSVYRIPTKMVGLAMI